MSAAADFPLDDATLILLAAACEINPDSGHTELHSLLGMGAVVKSSEDITHEIGDGEGAPVYYVEYEEGREPFSETQVIRCLVAEIQRLRASGSSER